MINYATCTQALPSSASVLATPARVDVRSTAGADARVVVRHRAVAPIASAARVKSVLPTVGVQHLLGSDMANLFGTPVDVRRDVATGVHPRGRPVST